MAMAKWAAGQASRVAALEAKRSWNNTVTATWGNTAQNAWNSMNSAQQSAWSAANPGVNPMTAQVVNQQNADGRWWAIGGGAFVNNQQTYIDNPQTIPQNPTTQTANTPTTAQNVGNTSTQTPDNSYQWGSVYDYLTQWGKDASFWARKKLADQYWIGWYRGTAQQNSQLLNQLRAGGWAQAQGAATPQIQADPNGAMKQQKFGAEAAKLGNQYQGLRNTTIATNLKGVAVDAIKQWVINNDWDLQNVVIQYLQANGQTADITDPNWENTVDNIASKIKETPDYQVAINNKFSVDQFQNMDMDWLYGAMDNWILLPGTDVWKQLQESNKAGDMSAAKAKLNLKIQQGVANYIMDFRNTDPNSSVSSQATTMDNLGVVTDEAAGGTDNPLSALMAKFGLTASSKSTSLSMDPDVKSLIDQKTKLNGEIKSTKTVIDNLKTDLQAQITAWGGVTTEWYLEALAAEKGKPLIAKYQALVDQYNGVQGALSDTLQFKQFDQQAKAQEFNQNMSMLNFAMDYQKTQLWQSNWEKEFALKSKTSRESWKPDTSNPWTYYRTNAQGVLEFTTQPSQTQETSIKPTGNLYSVKVGNKTLQIDEAAAQSLQQAAAELWGGVAAWEWYRSKEKYIQIIKDNAAKKKIAYNTNNPEETRKKLNAMWVKIAPYESSAHTWAMAVDLYNSKWWALNAEQSAIMQKYWWKQTAWAGDMWHWTYQWWWQQGGNVNANNIGQIAEYIIDTQPRWQWFSNDDVAAYTKAVNKYAARWDTETVMQLYRNQLLKDKQNAVVFDSATNITNKIALTQDLMKKYEDWGGNMNIFNGTMQNVTEKLWNTGNPLLVQIWQNIGMLTADFIKQTSWTAAADKEVARLINLLPSTSSKFDRNMLLSEWFKQRVSMEAENALKNSMGKNKELLYDAFPELKGQQQQDTNQWWIDRLWVDNQLQSSNVAQTVRQKLFGGK